MTAVLLALSGVWVLLALGPALLRRQRLGGGAVLVLITLGTPILGLLTWQFGPVVGFASLGIGALCLSVVPRRRRGGTGGGGAQPAE
jgi:hypothetical protein